MLKSGDVISTSLKRIAHTGKVYKVDSKYVYTVEGNTSSAETGLSKYGDGTVIKDAAFRKSNSIK